MPAPHSRFRALKEDYRALLDERDAWPKYAAMLSLLKRDHHGGRRADLVAMRRGTAVPEKYVRGLVDLMRCHPALGDYLAAQGVPDHRGLSTDQMIELVAGPLQARGGPGRPEDDWQIRGLNGLAEIFTDFVWRKLVHPETLCQDEEDVRTAITMIMATVGRQHPRGTGRLADAEAIGLAEGHMKITYEDYLGRAIGLWRAAPWTFAFGVVGRQRVACGCVLPLKAAVYEELRRGERDSHSCAGADLAVPSRTLLIEAFGHKPDAEYPFLKNKTIQTIRIIYLQLARLSLREGGWPLPDDRPLRLLSFAGDPLNEKRLNNSGFRRTGARMPGIHAPLMEMDDRKAWWTPLVVGKLQERLIASGEAE